MAEPLTITGSIGVITGKFNLAELYRRAGYAKTSISKGRRALQTIPTRTPIFRYTYEKFNFLPYLRRS